MGEDATRLLASRHRASSRENAYEDMTTRRK
jgi:hypothetical protein